MWRYPFDTLAIEALRKARSLGEAVIVLLRADLEEEAYGLSRSIVELALNMRFITADPALQEKRTWQFVRHTIRDREYWLHWALRRAPDEATKREFLAYGERFGLKADEKAGHQHWTRERNFIQRASDLKHLLDPADLESDYRAMKRAGDYTFPSGFVHCSQRALDSKIMERDQKLTARGEGRSDIDFGLRASDLAFQYIKEIVSYVLYGLGIAIQVVSLAFGITCKVKTMATPTHPQVQATADLEFRLR